MQQESRAALISVHPKYAARIIDGSKRIEFRRVWAANKVKHLVLYSTSPEMRVVAVMEIMDVFKEGKEVLWELAKQHGGGVTRQELRDYYSGVKRGYALLLDNVMPLIQPIPLADVLPGMRPPQSYAYLTADQFEAIRGLLSKGV